MSFVVISQSVRVRSGLSIGFPGSDSKLESKEFHPEKESESDCPKAFNFSRV